MRFNLFQKRAAPDDSPLPAKEARKLILRGIAPANLRVSGHLNLSDNSSLKELPDGLTVESLELSGCEALGSLPSNLRGWPQKARVGIGRLRAANCAQITSLPRWLTDVAQLDVSGCINLTELPEGLRVTSWLDLANSGIKSLPASIKGARLRWRGVPIDERIAFRPETITAKENLAETNAELRRVLLERMAYEAFLSEAEAETLDRDRCNWLERKKTGAARRQAADR